MKERRLRVGLIGAGFVTGFHIQSWIGVRDADITAICDCSSSSALEAQKLCEKLNVGKPKVYTEISKMVRDRAVDAVWIAVPNFARVQILEKIAEEVLSKRAKLVGIACEKPLARNVAEATKMLTLVEDMGILHGYLENQVFAPSLMKGREIIWRRGAPISGPPYLARCAEEHSGPHKPWFWSGFKQGGGVMNDMMCHSLEAGRYLLTQPGRSRDSLKVKSIAAEINSLKWTRKEYIKQLRDKTQGEIDYSQHPAEDFGRASVTYVAEDGHTVVSEATTSWSFVGTGLRLKFELLGPEYFMEVDTCKPDLHVFFSREIRGETGEDLVEKQNAEQGLMPVVADEALIYGYTDENRHMVRSFLEGKKPRETWKDGIEVVRLVMSCYMAAEQGRTLPFPPSGLADFVPKVALGTWRP
ncbi:MAG: Gfo/Idh/MocA family protein [bacterium]